MTDFVLHGDCLEVMADMPGNSVDAIVSDPPYGLSFMGKQWDHGVPAVPFWAEALRVAKPGAYLVAFGGTRTYHRLTCAIEDAGWEIRDCLSWLYGSGFPKSHNGPWGGTALKPAWEPIILARKPLVGTVAANVAQYGTGGINVDGCRIGLEGAEHHTTPARSGLGAHGVYGASTVEFVPTNDTLPRYNLSGRWPANVVLDEEAAGMLDAQTGERMHGAGAARAGSANPRKAAVNMFGVATDTGEIHRYGDSGGASRFFFVAQEGQCETANDATPTSSPADGLADSAQSLASQSHSQEKCGVGLDSTPNCACSTPRHSPASAEPKDNTATTPTTPTCCESCGSAFPVTDASTNRGSAEAAAAVNVLVSGTRFLYTAKASRKEREAGLEGMPEREYEVAVIQTQGVGLHGESLNGKQVSRSRNHHPTVKPIALMRWLCRLVTPPSGVVLDPFTGSGTTGCAAVLEGFRFVGIEREAEYVEIAEKRIAHWAGQKSEPDLFA